MAPFINNDNEDLDLNQISENKNAESRRIDLSFFKDDRKFFLIGGVASIITFCVVACIMYSNSNPVNLEDLPVIKADTTPIKVKPQNTTQVDHQDKVVYDNISGERRKADIEKTIPQQEEILSINEMDADGALSEEEKRNIIRAFDDLAPEKEYKINYIKTKKNKGKAVPNSAIAKSTYGNIEIEEEPPLKKISVGDHSIRNRAAKKRKNGILSIIDGRDDVVSYSDSQKGKSIMIQVASLPTKPAAEAEYKRLQRKSRILKRVGRKIVKIDLGKSKGVKYRLQIGPFKNRSEAQKVVSDMRENGISAYIAK
jgi:hypothetical protein